MNTTKVAPFSTKKFEFHKWPVLICPAMAVFTNDQNVNLV